MALLILALRIVAHFLIGPIFTHKKDILRWLLHPFCPPYIHFHAKTIQSVFNKTTIIFTQDLVIVISSYKN